MDDDNLSSSESNSGKMEIKISISVSDIKPEIMNSLIN